MVMRLLRRGIRTESVKHCLILLEEWKFKGENRLLKEFESGRYGEGRDG